MSKGGKFLKKQSDRANGEGLKLEISAYKLLTAANFHYQLSG